MKLNPQIILALILITSELSNCFPQETEISTSTTKKAVLKKVLKKIVSKIKATASSTKSDNPAASLDIKKTSTEKLNSDDLKVKLNTKITELTADKNLLPSKIDEIKKKISENPTKIKEIVAENKPKLISSISMHSIKNIDSINPFDSLKNMGVNADLSDINTKISGLGAQIPGMPDISSFLPTDKKSGVKTPDKSDPAMGLNMFPNSRLGTQKSAGKPESTNNAEKSDTNSGNSDMFGGMMSGLGGLGKLIPEAGGIKNADNLLAGLKKPTGDFGSIMAGFGQKSSDGSKSNKMPGGDMFKNMFG